MTIQELEKSLRALVQWAERSNDKNKERERRIAELERRMTALESESDVGSSEPDPPVRH